MPTDTPKSWKIWESFGFIKVLSFPKTGKLEQLSSVSVLFSCTFSQYSTLHVRYVPLPLIHQIPTRVRSTLTLSINCAPYSSGEHGFQKPCSLLEQGVHFQCVPHRKVTVSNPPACPSWGLKKLRTPLFV